MSRLREEVTGDESRVAHAQPTGNLPLASGKGILTPRSLLLAIVLILLWTFASAGIVINAGRNHAQIFLLVIGFGAILTVFLLQFPRLLLFGTLGVWSGAWALMFSHATGEDYARLTQGLILSAPVMLLLVAIAISLWRHPLSRAELVILYTCVLIAIPWSFCIKAVIESSAGNLLDVQRNGEPVMYGWARTMPWWAPTSPDDQQTSAAITGFARGNGGNVPWSMWWRPLLYWTTTCIAFQAMLMGLILMFRRIWIEHERLPMVWSEPAIQIIQHTPDTDDARPAPSAPASPAPVDAPSPGAAPRPRSSTRRWLPFAIGLAICLPAIVYTGPTGEPLGGWSMPPWAGAGEGLTRGFDLTSLNLIPGVNLRLFWGPLVLTLLLLFPLDLLLTAALTHILFVIVLPPLSTAMGFQLGPRRVAEFNNMGLRFGGGAGLLIWSIWFNRKIIADYFRALWGGKPRSRESADQLPRALLAGLFIFGTIGFFLLGLYATSAEQMVFVVALVLIYAFWQVRVRMEGMPTGGEGNLPSHQMNGIQRTVLLDHPTLATKADPATGQPYPVTSNSWGAHFFLWGFASQLKLFGPHNMLLEAFRVAHQFRVPARRIALAVLLTMVLVAIVFPVLYVQLMYVYGFENSFAGDLATWSSFTQWSERSAKYGLVTTSTVFIRFEGSFYERYENVFFAAIGVAIMGVLFHLRREYPRFLIHPVGVVIGVEALHGPADFRMSPDWIWFSFLLAGLFKLMAFRWVGVRTYRERIQPALVLILLGMIFGFALYLFRQLTFGVGTLK